VTDLVAGIDIATQHARVVLVGAAGTVVVTSSAPLAARQVADEIRVEQDARSWWPAVCTALRSATRSLDRSDRIVAVTPTATSGTIVLADQHGEPTSPAILYNDRRAPEQAQRAQDLGAERWARCGITVTAASALAKLGWLAHAGALEHAAHAWSPADLVVSRLTGDAAPTDWSHALKFGYDPVAREWATDVQRALGIPDGLLAPVVAPASLVGHVCRAAAADTGLSPDCEVRLGMTDGCTAQIASVPSSPGRFVSVLGTTLVVKGVSERLLLDPSGVVYSHLHPDGHWLPGGASNCGGGALARWASGDLGALDRAAERRGPATVITYPLTQTGERFPFLAPSATGFSLGVPVGDADAFRAVLEGVAFVERLAYAHLMDLGAEIRGPVATAGGGARSSAWNRIRATVLDRPVSVPAHSESGFGAAVLAASQTLHPSLADASAQMVTETTVYEPVGSESSALADRYQRFVGELASRGWIVPQLAGAAGPSPARP
jgi:sugar (pentulose or hexulose) kinase